MEEQAVAAEALDVTLESGVGAAQLVGDLAQPRAGEDAEEEGALELGTAQPVGGGEGL